MNDKPQPIERGIPVQVNKFQIATRPQHFEPIAMVKKVARIASDFITV